MKKERTLIKYFPKGKEDIDKYFIVDEENQKVWNRKTGNELKFHKNDAGYPRFSITINKKKIHIKVHQFFWYYKYNYLPEELDHIDRNRKNYKLENLRPATNRQNSLNALWNKRTKKHIPRHIYQVGGKKSYFIRIDGKYVGCSLDLDEAIKMRDEAYKTIYSEEDKKYLPI
jgi:hypothetical protein